mgnify:FL=1
MSLPNNNKRGKEAGREGEANYQNRPVLCQGRGVTFRHSQGEGIKLILRLLVNHILVIITQITKIVFYENVIKQTIID